MIKSILLVALALATLITAPAFMGTYVAAQNDTSTDGGGTDTTDGTTTDGGGTDTTTTDTTTTDTTWTKVTAKFDGSNYKWECAPSSGKSFKVAVEPGTTVKVSRQSGESGLGETNNWGGYLRLEGVTHGGKTFVKEAAPSKADMSGSAYGDKFSITGTITKDTLCGAPHVGEAMAGNLTSTELGELSEVGKSLKIEGPCNDSAGTVTVTAGGKSKTFGHTNIECSN